MLWKLCIIILVELVCILKIPVTCDLVQASEVTEVHCSGCHYIPDAKSNSSLKDASHFSVIFGSNNNTVLIGARDSLLIITLEGELIHHFVMKSTPNAFTQCLYRNNGNTEKCFNTIDFIIQQDNRVIVVCGQNSGEPNCQKVNGTEILSSSFSPSYYTRQNMKYINTDTYVFTAYQALTGKGGMSKIDIHGKTPKLERAFKTSTSPRFISVYEFDNFIYFFFNEFAEEIMDKANTVVYSRVARICKYDKGGKAFSGFFKDLILFAKARLLCDKPKGSTHSSTVHYNILEQTSFVKTKNGSVFIYGVFQSDDPDVDLSVICRFSLSEIENVFMTSTYYKDGKNTEKRDPNDPRLKKVYLRSAKGLYLSSYCLSMFEPPSIMCNSSLDTKTLTKDVLNIAINSPLAYTAVKPDGDGPVLELHDARISHILSDHVASSLGSYHVIYLFDSNEMYDVTVPIKLPGVTHVLSRTKIFKDPLRISTVAKIKDVLLVAAKEVLAFIPEAPCQFFNSCRDCISARNPFCAWYENSCVKYDPSQNSAYKQDIEDGNYTNVCDPEEASCELSIKGRLIHDEKVELSCKLYGVPKAKVKSWMRNGVILDPHSDNMDETQADEETHLLIKKYNLDVVGNYTCNVDNGLPTGGSCSVVLPGSSPQLKSRVTKNGSWWLTCDATGFPKPIVFYQSGTKLKTDVDKIEISDDEISRCVAYSVFGMANGDTYKIFSKLYEVKIYMPWNQKYADVGSSDYAELSQKLNKAVQTLYKNNERFGGIGNVTFSKGSVIASFVLSGVTISLHGGNEFTTPLQDAISNGKLGELNITEYNGEPDPSPVHQSTSKPLTTASTRPSTPRSGSPKSSRPFPTTRPSSSPPPFTGLSGPPKADSGDGSSSSGVAVWLVVFLILFLGILIFIAAYCCGMRNLLCSWRKQRRSSNSLSEEGGEMAVLSREEKGRESRKKLIHCDNTDNAAKRQNNIAKKTNSHKDVSEEDIHGSVEIKPVNDQNTC